MAAQSRDGTALITGAAGRSGQAIARLLTPRWTIVLHEAPEFSREAEELAHALRAAGGHAVAVDADLGDVAATGTLVARAIGAVGPVNLLVNATTYFGADRGGFDASSWARHFAVNLRAPCQLAEDFAAALPLDARGAIVNLVDQRLWQNVPGARSYELSQAALCCATGMMARAYAPRIRVNAVGPPRAIASEGEEDTQWHRMPLESAGAPEAIATAVFYLATAAAVTGQTIAIAP